MKRYNRLLFLVAVLAIIAELATFVFFTHNIFDLVGFTASKAGIMFVLLLMIVITTATSYFPPVQKEAHRPVHIIICAVYFVVWLLFAIKRTSYYSSLVVEQFISNQTNVFLQMILWGNLIWGLILIALTLISLIKRLPRNS